MDKFSQKFTMKNNRVTIDSQMIGDEPEWNNVVVVEDIEIGKALNWYSYTSTVKDAQQWFVDWAKKTQKLSKEEVKKISKYDIASFDSLMTGRTLGFLCRMMLRGLPDISEKSRKKLENLLETAKQHEVKTTEEESSNEVKPNIQERIHSQVMQYVGELEFHFDEFIKFLLEKEEYKFDFYKWLKENEIKPLIAKRIAESIRNEVIVDFDILLNGEPDDDLKEGYAFLKKPQIKKIYNFIHKAIDDCEKWAAANSKSRSPRKKKPVSIEKLVSKLKYKKQDDTYKIGSISPDKIIGAQQLWIFNTKTRKLGVYYSSEPEGFTVKGTTLINFDEKTSVQKTLRKPEDYLDKVSKSGKLVLKKIMSEIKAVETPLNGRINGETIILRAL